MSEERLGRYGHHPDPAIDFEAEVDGLEGLWFDFKHKCGAHIAKSALMDRMAAAADFRVGGDPGAVAAKRRLEKIVAEAAAGPETYPGHDPAAGLPKPSTEKGGDANLSGPVPAHDNARPRSPDTAGGAEPVYDDITGKIINAPPTPPMDEAARQAKIAELKNYAASEIKRIADREAAIRAEERRLVVERVKALPTTSMCPFDLGQPNNLKPEDPCPLCGELGTLDSEPKCDGGFRQRVIEAIRGGSRD